MPYTQAAYWYTWLSLLDTKPYNDMIITSLRRLMDSLLKMYDIHTVFHVLLVVPAAVGIKPLK